jgi:hypothetical protein
MKAWRRRLGVGVLVAILVSVALGAGVIAEGERGRERPDSGRRDRCEAVALRPPGSQ